MIEQQAVCLYMYIYMFSLLVHLYDLITITILPVPVYINTLKIIELQAILVIVSIMLVICDIHGGALIWNKDIYLFVLYYYKFDCMSNLLKNKPHIALCKTTL